MITTANVNVMWVLVELIVKCMIPVVMLIVGLMELVATGSVCVTAAIRAPAARLIYVRLKTNVKTWTATELTVLVMQVMGPVSVIDAFQALIASMRIIVVMSNVEIMVYVQ